MLQIQATRAKIISLLVSNKGKEPRFPTVQRVMSFIRPPCHLHPFFLQKSKLIQLKYQAHNGNNLVTSPVLVQML